MVSLFPFQIARKPLRIDISMSFMKDGKRFCVTLYSVSKSDAIVHAKYRRKFNFDTKCGRKNTVRTFENFEVIRSTVRDT